MARQRDVEAQRARLSEATWSVLAEGGLPRLTLRAVAERAGCTTGLVLHAFPDRRALLADARQRLHRSAAARVEAAEREAENPEQALEEVLLHVLALDTEWSAEPRVWVSFLAASLADPDLAEHHRAGNRALLARVARLVADRNPDWEEGQVKGSAVALVALVEGLNVLSVGDPESYPADVQRAAVVGAVELLA